MKAYFGPDIEDGRIVPICNYGDSFSILARWCSPIQRQSCHPTSIEEKCSTNLSHIKQHRPKDHV